MSELLAMEAEQTAQPTTDPVVIRLRDVRGRFANGHPTVLDVKRLDIRRGERVALIGPSGAGKTTLLRLVNGYVEPTRGEVQILDRTLQPQHTRNWRKRWTREERARVGFVFQDFSLIERATVFHNVLWGRLGRVHPLWSLFGWFPVSAKALAMEAIEEVGLLDFAGQRVDNLSGGQQQRVGVARVLAQEAEIILADEPVSNLDPALADEVLQLLTEASDRHGATLLMSLHQPQLALRYAQRIVGLAAGKVVYDAPAAQFDKQALVQIYGSSPELSELQEHMW